MISYKQIKVDRYVGESLTEIIAMIKTESDIMLKAPTGSGKTMAMLSLRERLPGRKIAFLCPTRALVDNIGKYYPDVPCVYGAEKLNAFRRAYYIVTTYDSIKVMAEWDFPPELLIIDEAHLIIGHSEFREVTADILRTGIQKVFLSATPEIIEGWYGLSHIEITTRKVPKNVNIATLGNRNPTSVIQDLLRDPGRYVQAECDYGYPTGSRKLVMIRYNNKKELKEIYHNLPKNLKDVTAMYYSDRAELYEMFRDGHTERLEKGIVPESVEILLVTSIYDAGLSLDVKREVDCYAITNSIKRMPHPIDMVQLQNRVRITSTQSPMNLTIIGNFGSLDLGDIEGWPTTKKPEMWLKYAYTGWDAYRELDKNAYKGILDCYGVQSHDAFLPIRSKHKQGHRLSNIDIARNMASFPELFEEVEQRLNHAGYMNWIEFVQGTEDIRHNGIPPQAYTIKNQLIGAIKCDLHFSLFMGEDRYHEKRVSQLIASVMQYQQGGRFKYVIDQLFADDLADVEMPLEEYHLLVSNQQKMVNEVARLFYTDVRFQKGRTKKLLSIKPREELEEAIAYKFCLINGIDDTWYELQHKKAV